MFSLFLLTFGRADETQGAGKWNISQFETEVQYGQLLKPDVNALRIIQLIFDRTEKIIYDKSMLMTEQNFQKQ